jgi:cation diffusion facilitator family transporter
MNSSEIFSESETPGRQAAARKSTLVSVAVNLLLTVSQVVAGIVSGSQGLIADGIHSLSDLVADFVVLLANQHSGKEADSEHHYGHYRFETAASLVLGLLLLVVGIGMLWSAIAKLRSPADIAPVQIMALWVALGTLVVKEGLFRYMLAVAERVRSTMLVANAWHARSDAASSLVVALGIGGSLLGFPLLDPVAALIVGIMVGKMGWKFTWEALHDPMDRAPENVKLLLPPRQSWGNSQLIRSCAKPQCNLLIHNVRKCPILLPFQHPRNCPQTPMVEPITGLCRSLHGLHGPLNGWSRAKSVLCRCHASDNAEAEQYKVQ